MKAIIKGLRYDTEKAILLASDSSSLSRTDFGYWEESLYKTPRSGAYFTAGMGGALSSYSVSYGSNGRGGGAAIRPLSEAAAREWVEDHCSADKYEEIFGPAQEA